MIQDGYTYDLFFSYRHQPLDSAVTERMFNRVESYRLPASLRAQGYPDIARAFRDTEELSVSRILTQTIDEALRASECLVVVCSTDTPSSDWVDREVMTFIELGRENKIYPLLISGDEETSFPPSMKHVPGIRERIMDARCPGAPDVRRILERAQKVILKAVAASVGCREEELVRENDLRNRHIFVKRCVTAAAVLLAAAGISGILMHMAQAYRDDARRHADASMQILQELTYGLPDHLTNVPGAYSRIADILEENTEDLNAVLRLSGDRQDVQSEMAANFEKLANARSVLGMYDEALAAQEKALEIYRALHAGAPEEFSAALSSAYNNRGSILHRGGRYKEAEEDFSRAILLAPASETIFLAGIYGNAGANASDSGNAEAAEEYYELGLKTLGFVTEGAASGSENGFLTQEALQTAALISRNEGVLFYRSGRYSEASMKLELSCGLYERLLAVTDSLQNRSDHLSAVSALAACLTDEGRTEEADEYYEQAIELAEILAADSENIAYQRVLAELCNNRGLNLNIGGRYEEAYTYYSRAAGIRREILAQTDTASDRAELALAILNTGENTFKEGRYPDARELFEEGLREYETACGALETYDRAQFEAWSSYYALLFVRDPEEAYRRARTACELQPDGVLPHLNLAYACLYSGRYEECDELFRILSSLGAGQRETIRQDLEAQERAGLADPHADAVREML